MGVGAADAFHIIIFLDVGKEFGAQAHRNNPDETVPLAGASKERTAVYHNEIPPSMLYRTSSVD